MQPASRIYKAKLQSLFFLSFFVFLPETCFTSSPDYHAALCWVILPNVSRLHPTTRKKQQHYRLIGGCRAPQGELLAAIILSFSPSFCFSFSSCMAAVWRLIRAHADVSQSIFSKKKKKNILWITWFLFKNNETTKKRNYPRQGERRLNEFLQRRRTPGHTPSTHTIYTAVICSLITLHSWKMAFSAVHTQHFFFLFVGKFIICLFCSRAATLLSVWLPSSSWASGVEF